jgi:hypothetical protein
MSSNQRHTGHQGERSRQRAASSSIADQLVHLHGHVEAPQYALPDRRSSQANRSPHRRTAESLTSTEPPVASAHNRPASIAAAPNQPPPLRTMSPLLTPTRKHRSLPPTARRRATA